jgi:hypothetical protein
MNDSPDVDKLQTEHFANNSSDKDRKSTLNFDFNGEADVLFEDGERIFGLAYGTADKYSNLTHLLNSKSKEISEAISAELKSRLNYVGSDVDVNIEFKKGSLLFTGLIVVTDFLARLNGTVGGIKLLVDAAKFAINQVVRKEIENSVPATVKSISTNVSERRIREKDPINPITRFLWWCAGAVTEILRHCPEDKAKFQTIGLAVFATGLLASISGSYALITMLGTEPHLIVVSIILGLIWGFIVIFNLDRSIVSSMRKHQIEGASWFRTFLFAFKLAFPRMVLAIILGVVIAKPLELRFFRNQIATKVETERTTLADQYATTLRNGKHAAAIQTASDELRAAQAAYDKAQGEVDKYTKIFNDEMDANGGTGRYGYGPVATKKEQDKKLAVKQRDQLQIKLNTIRQKSSDTMQTIDGNIANEREQYAASVENDFSRQLEALWKLTQESKGLWWANVGIMMLLITIELLPVLVKLLSPAGPYDARLEQRERVAKEKARLSRESEIKCAAIKAESSVDEATHQSEIHNEELRLRGVAVKRILAYQYQRIIASEKTFNDAFFNEADEVRLQMAKEELARWQSDVYYGTTPAQSFDDLVRQTFKKRGINLNDGSSLR